MLTALQADHRGRTRSYYLDVPFEETLLRHATKSQAREYGRAEMAQWYRSLDLLHGSGETVIPAESSLDDTVRRIMRDTGLGPSAEPRPGPAAQPAGPAAPVRVPAETSAWDGIGLLRAHHSEVPPAVQLLKLTEEAGEAAAAYIGMTGLNSRKGVCATREDLLDELGDVIITAAVAMTAVSGDTVSAGACFRGRLAAVMERAGLA